MNYQVKILQTAIGWCVLADLQKVSYRNAGPGDLAVKLYCLLNSTYNSRKASLKSFFHRLLFSY